MTFLPKHLLNGIVGELSIKQLCLFAKEKACKLSHL
jgi:hypothetical protein